MYSPAENLCGKAMLFKQPKDDAYKIQDCDKLGVERVTDIEKKVTEYLHVSSNSYFSSDAGLWFHQCLFYCFITYIRIYVTYSFVCQKLQKNGVPGWLSG